MRRGDTGFVTVPAVIPELQARRRRLLPLALVARLEAFPRSLIERAGGSLVVQYRDRILPLIPLRTVLESGRAEAIEIPDPVDVIVFDPARNSEPSKRSTKTPVPLIVPRNVRAPASVHNDLFVA